MVTQLDLPDTATTLALPSLPEGAQISSNKPSTPGVDQWIAIKSCGYASQNEAEEAALRIKDLILIAGSQGFGVDFGLDKTRSILSDAIKSEIKDKFGTIIRDEVHGIDVFESGDVRHFEASAHFSAHMELQQFANKVAEGTDLPRLTAITRTGAELINDSMFTMPVEASFLLRITSIEALSEQDRRSRQVQDLINRLIMVLPCLTDDSTVASLMTNVLAEARKQSVRQACLGKIRLRLGDEAANKFDGLYKLRSKYLHEGMGRGSFSEASNEALQIARDLHMAEIKGATAKADVTVAPTSASRSEGRWHRLILIWRLFQALSRRAFVICAANPKGNFG
jgi:hypothetical protein